MRKKLIGFLIAAAASLAPLHARAGIPVIDITAIANLMQQVMYWQQQISGMQKQYEQLRQSRDQLAQTYSSMTGTRGMEQLLPTSELARNYLPPSYGELMSTVNGSSIGYSGLANQVQSIMRANSILSGSQMEALSPELRQVVEQGRQASAMLNGMTQGAYQNTSQRFSALQQLIDRIGTAQDPKAIQDLQARIQAEQNMLTNEQTKLQGLYQVAQVRRAGPAAAAFASNDRHRPRWVQQPIHYQSPVRSAMIKTIMDYVVVAIVVAVAAGGAYYYFTRQEATIDGTSECRLHAPAQRIRRRPTTMLTPKLDGIGSFQKRFQTGASFERR